MVLQPDPQPDPGGGRLADHKSHARARRSPPREPRARHESQSPLLQKHASPLARASETGEERVGVRTEHRGPAAAPLSSSGNRLRRYAPRTCITMSRYEAQYGTGGLIPASTLTLIIPESSSDLYEDLLSLPPSCPSDFHACIVSLRTGVEFTSFQ